MGRKDKKKSKKGLKIFIAILIIVIVASAGILAYKFYQDNKQQEVVATEPEPKLEPVVEEKKVQIYQGNDRPIAVMIDNHSGAWPQAGLNDAYMVYEIIVEGGETRLMALFKGKDLEKIGPVRSSRHYFIDYALENDAIYVHYGWSPQAERDIKRYSVNNINGINESSSNFWRTKDKRAPHNVATNTESILQIAAKKKYRTTSSAESVLNYVADEFDLAPQEEAQTAENTVNTSSTNTATTANTAATTTAESAVKNANTVTIPHSQLQTVKYEYNAETKQYTRYARNKLQTDWDTKSAVTTKNIIIEFADNSTLSDGSGKGRQTLSNIGTFNGYYITNGKAIKIKCTKSARDEKTIYKDLEGNEIEVNDGNTWVNICPKNAAVKIL